MSKFLNGLSSDSNNLDESHVESFLNGKQLFFSANKVGVGKIPSGSNFEILGDVSCTGNYIGSLNADTCTITNLTNSSIKVGAGIDASKIANSTVDNTEFQCLNGVSSNIQTQLDGKANTSHTHTISNITNLQTSLDGKLNLSGGTMTGDLIVNANLTTNNLLLNSFCNIATTGANSAIWYLVDGTIYINPAGNNPAYGMEMTKTSTIFKDDVIFNKNLTINGTSTQINTTNVSVGDPLVSIGRNNVNDTLSLGQYCKYVDGATTRYCGIFRNQSLGNRPWTFFQNLTVEPTTTVSTTDSSFQLADAQCKDLYSTRVISDAYQSSGSNFLFKNNLGGNIFNCSATLCNIYEDTSVTGSITVSTNAIVSGTLYTNGTRPLASGDLFQFVNNDTSKVYYQVDTNLDMVNLTQPTTLTGIGVNSAGLITISPLAGNGVININRKTNVIKITSSSQLYNVLTRFNYSSESMLPYQRVTVINETSNDIHIGSNTNNLAGDIRSIPNLRLTPRMPIDFILGSDNKFYPTNQNIESVLHKVCFIPWQNDNNLRAKLQNKGIHFFHNYNSSETPFGIPVINYAPPSNGGTYTSPSVNIIVSQYTSPTTKNIINYSNMTNTYLLTDTESNKIANDFGGEIFQIIYAFKGLQFNHYYEFIAFFPAWGDPSVEERTCLFAFQTININVTEYLTCVDPHMFAHDFTSNVPGVMVSFTFIHHSSLIAPWVWLKNNNYMHFYGACLIDHGQAF